MTDHYRIELRVLKVKPLGNGLVHAEELIKSTLRETPFEEEAKIVYDLARALLDSQLSS